MFLAPMARSSFQVELFFPIFGGIVGFLRAWWDKLRGKRSHPDEEEDAARKKRNQGHGVGGVSHGGSAIGSQGRGWWGGGHGHHSHGHVGRVGGWGGIGSGGFGGGAGG